MPFYTGSTADGSDMAEVSGVYINPDNPNEWCNRMYPAQVRHNNMTEEYLNYVDGRFCLNDVYKQIKAKTCPLSKRVRDWVLSHYDDNGKFKYENNDTNAASI